MEMCKGLKEQIEYDAKGLKCLGELRNKETEDFIRNMVETTNNFIDENIADETTGRPPLPMTDEGSEQMSKINMQ